MNEKHTSRNHALDLVRVFAFFCVVSVHFFKCTGYYDIIMVGPRMYVSTLVRTFFMICVPLFLILSGYLMRAKTVSRQYYHKLTGILLEYLLASLFCALYCGITRGFPEGIRYFLIKNFFGVFSYTTAPYGWYVEMYIGLFLLIPYLNILYNQLSDSSQKRRLLLTLLILTSIPGLTNSFSLLFADTEFYLTLLPSYWSALYPITYYFIGAYLSEYPIRLKKRKLILLILLTAVLSGSFSFWKSYNSTFVNGIWQPYESIFTVLQAVLVFSLLSQFPIQSGSLSARILSRLSSLCFSAYLVSYIFDDLIYVRTGLFGNASVYRLELYTVTVPLVFACSLLQSAAIRGCLRLSSCIRKHIKRQGVISNVP